MIDLAEFLLARYDEDEAEARGASAVHLGADESRWKGVAWGEGIGQVLVDGPRGMPVADTQNRGDFGGLGWYAARHIARWDPARVLAEVEAKRIMVKRFAELLYSFDNPGSGPWPDVTRRERHHARDGLARMAAVYADHPDYSEEWRP